MLPQQNITGATTGQNWLDLAELDQSAYIMGFIDGLSAGPFLGSTPDCIEKVWRCVQGKTGRQMAAMVRKHLNDNPDRWQYAVSGQAFAALVGTCRL